MENEGWIKLFRKFTKWEWYKDNNVKVVFLHLLLLANYEDRGWKGQLIKRGQLVTSISHLAKEVNLSVKQVRLAIDKLKRTNEITTEGQSKYTLITIENYEKYQFKDERNGKQRASNRANKGQTKGKLKCRNCKHYKSYAK